MNVGAKVWIQDKDDAWVQAMVATRSGGGAEALKLTMTLENVAPPETRELILKLGESESESDKIKLRNIFDREEGASPPAHRTMNRLAAESVRSGGAGFKFAKMLHACTRWRLLPNHTFAACVAAHGHSGCAVRVYGTHRPPKALSPVAPRSFIHPPWSVLRRSMVVAGTTTRVHARTHHTPGCYCSARGAGALQGVVAPLPCEVDCDCDDAVRVTVVFK